MQIDHISKATEQPRIYVACLASYNAGILHGAWVDAAQEPWALFDAVAAMLAVSPMAEAEEFAIHDYEGFGDVRIDEFMDLDHLAEVAAFIVTHGSLGAALLHHCDRDLDEAREAIEDRYHGSYSSLADYIQELTEEATAIPEVIRYHIDWQSMARDAELSGDLFTIHTGWDEVHVFAGC